MPSFIPFIHLQAQGFRFLKPVTQDCLFLKSPKRNHGDFWRHPPKQLCRQPREISVSKMTNLSPRGTRGWHQWGRGRACKAGGGGPPGPPPLGGPRGAAPVYIPGPGGPGAPRGAAFPRPLCRPGPGLARGGFPWAAGGPRGVPGGLVVPPPAAPAHPRAPRAPGPPPGWSWGLFGV